MRELINFKLAPLKYRNTLFFGKHYNYKYADIWIDNIINWEKFCNERFDLNRCLEDIIIKRINQSIAHELIHILCKTNNEDFIMSIPKTYDAFQWDEDFYNE